MRRLAALVHKPVSTIARIESGSSSPSVDLFNELLWVCGRTLAVVERNQLPRHQPNRSTETPMPEAPTTYPNPRGDDPWDNDAVHYLLEKADVAASFRRGPLAECLRRQPNRLEKQPHRVAEAEEFARRHGVRQAPMYDRRIGKDIVRLIRTDADAPQYPPERVTALDGRE